ncbi:hypothetical protein H6F38_23290 [Paenibacillus sp. EKM208P]|nr:hypothetical protein H6F38_23290 [Paenibacillus sp. EKM208P]
MKRLKELWQGLKPKNYKEWLFIVLAALAIILVLYVKEYKGVDLPIRTQDQMFDK